jgi:hypothetical protein
MQTETWTGIFKRPWADGSITEVSPPKVLRDSVRPWPYKEVLTDLMIAILEDHHLEGK